MCGINGIVDLTGPVSTDEVLAMCRIMRHRGPDNQGIWSDKDCCLGHNRLSIIDPSAAGNQPMTDEEGRFVLTYNGEIYNYKELKSSLRSAHKFRSSTDTEVLLHAWEGSGADILPELNGIFAFAVWDRKEHKLTIARDPLGVKPVYYWRRNGRLAFASEIKALLSLGIKSGLNPIALAEHFTFQNTLGDKTFFENIFILPAGHYLTFDAQGLKVTRYFDIEFDESPSGYGVNEYSHLIRECLEKAVKRQLMSDVPLGTYLSGGMDTGSIAALAVRNLPGMHSFTCGFDLKGISGEEINFDERANASAIASYLGTTHHELVLDHEAMEQHARKTIWHLDEPRMGISYQVLCIAEAAGRHVKVVLSGAGGDELFGGYPWRYPGDTGNDNDAAYRAALRFFGDNERSALFSEDMNRRLGGYSAYTGYLDVMKECSASLPLNRAFYWDLKTFLHGILVVEDKLNMAHSVESRVPLLDKELVALALRTPAGYKLQDGTGKVVLRQAMQGLLPAGIVSSRKQGFTPPDASWYRQHTMPYIKSVLLSKEASNRGIFSINKIEGIIEEHLSGKKNHRFLLWSLVSFELWQRMFLDTLTPAL